MTQPIIADSVSKAYGTSGTESGSTIKLEKRTVFGFDLPFPTSGESETRDRGKDIVLDEFSLEIEEGEVFGLLGENGAGKTTTIGILTGTTSVDSGAVEVLGHNPAEEPVTVRDKIGVLPEKESPPSFLTPNEYFEFIADVRDLSEEYLDNRVEYLANKLSFNSFNSLCKDLSRGQQQKVMLIQALVHNPEVVFIDEPLANLDPVIQERVKDLIREAEADGKTLVLSTHHVEVAEELCSRVGILEGGKIKEFVDAESLDEQTLRDVFIDITES